ncbi:MAG: hypothetical protein KDA99_18770, partial [Planctomycetales bacterium]|nr:hypothetical protein [Planctomycetales bacterium]
GDDGLEMIRSIKSNSQTSETPTMLISNFEDYQQMAISAGAVPGFGKAELGKNETLNKLRPYLA